MTGAVATFWTVGQRFAQARKHLVFAGDHGPLPREAIFLLAPSGVIGLNAAETKQSPAVRMAV